MNSPTNTSRVLFWSLALSLLNPGAFAGNGGVGGGFMDRGAKVLTERSNDIGSTLLHLDLSVSTDPAHPFHREFPEFARSRITLKEFALIIKNMRQNEVRFEKIKDNGRLRMRTMRWGKDRKGRFIEALFPIISQADGGHVVDLDLRIVHEAVHHLGIGVRHGSDHEARTYAEKLLEFTKNREHFTATESPLVRMTHRYIPPESTLHIGGLRTEYKLDSSLAELFFKFDEVGADQHCDKSTPLEVYYSGLDITEHTPKPPTSEQCAHAGQDCFLEWAESQDLMRRAPIAAGHLRFPVRFLDQSKKPVRIYIRSRAPHCEVLFRIEDHMGRSFMNGRVGPQRTDSLIITR